MPSQGEWHGPDESQGKGQGTGHVGTGMAVKVQPWAWCEAGWVQEMLALNAGHQLALAHRVQKGTHISFLYFFPRISFPRAGYRGWDSGAGYSKGDFEAVPPNWGSCQHPAVGVTSPGLKDSL